MPTSNKFDGFNDIAPHFEQGLAAKESNKKLSSFANEIFKSAVANEMIEGSVAEIIYKDWIENHAIDEIKKATNYQHVDEVVKDSFNLRAVIGNNDLLAQMIGFDTENGVKNAIVLIDLAQHQITVVPSVGRDHLCHIKRVRMDNKNPHSILFFMSEKGISHVIKYNIASGKSEYDIEMTKMRQRMDEMHQITTKENDQQDLIGSN